MIKQIAFYNSDAQTLILDESVDQIIDDPDGDGYVDTQKNIWACKGFRQAIRTNTSRTYVITIRNTLKINDKNVNSRPVLAAA